MKPVSRRTFLNQTGLGLAALSAPFGSLASADAPKPPNIIYIMADDLGYGDLGCYGQQRIKTPAIDQLAREGLRFTQCYAGSPVCSPSRSVLMTGQHTGHTRVRGNFCMKGGSEGYKGERKVRRMYLTREDTTVGHVLRGAGYRTCLVGKWHLGGYEPDATPLNRGFDEFYGRLTQTHSGGYFPKKRHRNRDLVEIPGNQDGKREVFSTDLCTEEAMDFIARHKDQRFFLYLAYKTPHSPYEAPDLEPYTDEPWPEPEKTYAAMITRLDRCVGKIMQQLRALDIDQDTIVFFCSDNGARSESYQEQTRVMEFFDSSGPLKGYKRDMFEGGIRVPMIVRWPGRVPTGETGDAPWYFADFLPTAAALAGAEVPQNVDGISILPTLLGQEQDTADRFLYWEFYERGPKQAVRWRNWKAIRRAKSPDIQLYDLSRDLGEENDVAAEHPQVVAAILAYLKTARTASPNWPIEFW